MKTTTWRKKLASFALVGATAAVMTVMPNSQASAADMRPGPPPPPHRIGMAGPGFHSTFDFSHRVQAMVRDGKITQDQAFKLYDEMKRFERKGQRDHRRFMHKLPERTGISEDTLKELFAPPKRDKTFKDGKKHRPAPPHRRGDRR